MRTIESEGTTYAVLNVKIGVDEIYSFMGDLVYVEYDQNQWSTPLSTEDGIELVMAEPTYGITTVDSKGLILGDLPRCIETEMVTVYPIQVIKEEY